MGFTGASGRAEAHLAGQEVHLGDGGRVLMQARELHAGGTVAEGDGSRAESRHRPGNHTSSSQDHSDRPYPTGLPIQGPPPSTGAPRRREHHLAPPRDTQARSAPQVGTAARPSLPHP